MAFSLESRVPLLDHIFVEFALRLKPEMLFRGGLSKFILRKAMEGRLPREVLWRRSKLGFAAPEQRWLGTISAAQARTLLIVPERTKRLFEDSNAFPSNELWDRLKARERFKFLTLDAWLSTLG